MTGDWDPRQYERFAGPRERPAMELLARVEHPGPRRVWDLGCGTGAMARRMAERWPAAEVVGVDRSEAMLERARAGAGRARFESGDLAEWRPSEPADVVYANASLHWLPDHPRLFPRLLDALAPGGVLAVQMPLSFELPSHVLLRATLDEGPFGSEELRARLARTNVLPAEDYVDLCAPRSSALEVWETSCLQLLEGPDAVLEWMRGTALRPVLSGLEDEERERFLARFRARLARQYPARPDGRTLYRFPRLFVVARLR